MWTIKWSALFHYYQNKKPEFDKAFVRGRKRNLRSHHLFHIGFPPPSSHWNLYGYIYIYIYIYFTMVLNHLYDTCIYTCSHHILMSHYRWVEGSERAYFHFMVWNLWTHHKLIDFHGLVTILHLCLASWFKKKKYIYIYMYIY